MASENDMKLTFCLVSLNKILWTQSLAHSLLSVTVFHTVTAE